MRKALGFLVISVVFCGGSLSAAPAEGGGTLPVEDSSHSKWSSLMTYFKHLKEGLTQSSVRAEFQKGRGVAVAAVRGAPQDDGKADPDRPAMRHPAKSRKQKLEAAETREFEKAVDLLEEGLKLKSEAKVDEGIAGLEAFEKGHPRSARIGEVRDALAKARELRELLKPNPGETAEPAKTGQ